SHHFSGKPQAGSASSGRYRVSRIEVTKWIRGQGTMSRIPFAGFNGGTHWTSDSAVFTSARDVHGPLAVRHGQNFGGTSAYAVLGPDICMTGGATNHTPTATGRGWDAAWGNAAAGGPAIYFTQDGANSWKRGHLINAEWGGSGSQWENLVPL